MLALLLAATLTAAEKPIPIKAVVVAMFEAGEDTGDRPGEFQFWVEREQLTEKLPFPAGFRPLRLNRKTGVLGVVTGAGVTNATSTITALGFDPRFDLKQAYWLIAGIAGVDPNDASLGSAAWANWVLDGDLVYELDAREAPADWKYGRIAVGAKGPGLLPVNRSSETMVYEMNGKLVDWAYDLTKNLKLPDSAEAAAYRATYSAYPKAAAPPVVMRGDSLGSSTYWHGARLTEWANDWVRLWTGGKGNFVMTNMEDNGTATALKRLERAGRVDFRRVMVLRTASNFCMPAPKQDSAASLLREYAGRLPALESAHMVGSKVLHEIVRDWKQWKVRVPGD